MIDKAFPWVVGVPVGLILLFCLYAIIEMWLRCGLIVVAALWKRFLDYMRRPGIAPSDVDKVYPSPPYIKNRFGKYIQ